MRQDIQVNWPQTWDEVFAGVPTSPGTEAEQQRHKELREQGEMTEAEEGELNTLFYVIYLQFVPETRQRRTRHSCRYCLGEYGDGICSYHANKTRRFKQRLSYIYRTSKRSINQVYQPDGMDGQTTLLDIFGALVEYFSIPLGGMIWLVWFSSTSFAVSMAYWMIVAYVTLVASFILWLERS